MKKISALILVFILLFALAGCTTEEVAADIAEPETDSSASEPETTPAPEILKADMYADDMNSEDGMYTVAFVTDTTPLKDSGYNENVWNGVKLYAAENSLSYKYYALANGEDATESDRCDAIQAAVDGGAQVVVIAGDSQAKALRKSAEKNPDVMFLFIDGYPLTASDSTTLSNVVGISFSEEQLGYLAGYASVMEGYTQLGFCGDFYSTGRDYGYSFLQGAEDAAKLLGTSVNVNYTLFYDLETTDFIDLQRTTKSWYTNGTEVIFVCEQSLFARVDEAADECGGLMIGADTDQSCVSDNVILSAVKNLHDAAYWALKSYFAGNLNETDNDEICLDAHGDFIGLPSATWRLNHFSAEEYTQLLEAVRSKAVLIDTDYPDDIESLNSDYLTVTDVY